MSGSKGGFLILGLAIFAGGAGCAQSFQPPVPEPKVETRVKIVKVPKLIVRDVEVEVPVEVNRPLSPDCNRMLNLMADYRVQHEANLGLLSSMSEDLNEGTRLLYSEKEPPARLVKVREEIIAKTQQLAVDSQTAEGLLTTIDILRVDCEKDRYSRK